MLLDLDHDRFMREALREAQRAFDIEEVPIGAIVVHEGRVIGRGHNQVERLHDPTAHAEIIALGAAATTIGDWRLNDATLYVTVEPCLMCAGALHWARVSGLVFGAEQPLAGVFGSQMDITQERWYNRQLWVQRGVLAEPCRSLLQEFFEIQRRGARAADWDGLENRCTGNCTEGSNPSLSATLDDDPPDAVDPDARRSDD